MARDILRYKDAHCLQGLRQVYLGFTYLDIERDTGRVHLSIDILGLVFPPQHIEIASKDCLLALANYADLIDDLY